MMDSAALYSKIRDTGNNHSSDYASRPGGLSLKFFVCPDDPQDVGQAGGLSYVANVGYISSAIAANLEQDYTHPTTPTPHEAYGYINWWNGNSSDNPVDTASTQLRDVQISYDTGVFWRQDSGGSNFRMTLDHISRGDGQTQTILFSENIQAGRWNDVDTGKIGFGVIITVDSSNKPTGVGHAADDLNRKDATSLDLNSFGTFAIGDSKINSDLGEVVGRRPRPSSNHAGSVNAMFADGHGQSLNESMDAKVYARLLTPAGVRRGQNVTGTDF